MQEPAKIPPSTAAQPPEAAKRPPRWRNRIVHSGEQRADQFLAHPENWRIHTATQGEVVSGLLDDLGWIDRVTVSARTGVLLNGHLRVKLALQAGEDEPIPFDAVDLDPTEEALALAMLDKSGELAIADAGNLDSVIAQAQADNAAVQQYLDDIASDMRQLAATQAVKGEESQIQSLREAVRERQKAGTSLKIALVIDSVDTFERAIRATGQPNRGHALEVLASFYLAANGSGEHDHSRFNTGWDALAESIRKRDNYTCRRCGTHQDEIGRRLDVHHIIPYRISHSNDPDNLIAICYRCHNPIEFGGPTVPATKEAADALEADRVGETA